MCIQCHSVVLLFSQSYRKSQYFEICKPFGPTVSAIEGVAADHLVELFNDLDNIYVSVDSSVLSNVQVSLLTVPLQLLVIFCLPTSMSLRNLTLVKSNITLAVKLRIHVAILMIFCVSIRRTLNCQLVIFTPRNLFFKRQIQALGNPPFQTKI